jgi:hypothetical protein
MLPTVAPESLQLVHGGQAKDSATPAGVDGALPAFGRCGPADRWSWLGDVRTSECAAHDAALRGALAAGSSRIGAHVRALPLLPAAVGSYVRESVR